MPSGAWRTSRFWLQLAAGLLVVKVTLAVVANEANYFPPNFNSDFLRGRDPYFYGPYAWAFYPHVVVGPLTLILGTLLVSDRFRMRFPDWHRRLGRIQAALVLFVIVPSGLWMAFYAAAGPIGGIGLAMLAISTGTCVAMGWRSAVKRRFAEHRRWMWRTYLLLCSAVVLRLIGGLATVSGLATTWIDPWAIWISWLIPISIYEWMERRNGGGGIQHSPVQHPISSQPNPHQINRRS